MEGLEKLRPFVRFCQIVGFFPFRMEMDLQSGKLKQFTFSYMVVHLDTESLLDPVWKPSLAPY